MSWRVGGKVKLNVYDSKGRPVCQCHTKAAAALIVAAVNHYHASVTMTICPPTGKTPARRLLRVLDELKAAAVKHLDTSAGRYMLDRHDALERGFGMNTPHGVTCDSPRGRPVSKKKTISLPRKAVRKK